MEQKPSFGCLCFPVTSFKQTCFQQTLKVETCSPNMRKNVVIVAQYGSFLLLFKNQSAQNMPRKLFSFKTVSVILRELEKILNNQKKTRRTWSCKFEHDCFNLLFPFLQISMNAEKTPDCVRSFVRILSAVLSAGVPRDSEEMVRYVKVS